MFDVWAGTPRAEGVHADEQPGHMFCFAELARRNNDSIFIWVLGRPFLISGHHALLHHRDMLLVAWELTHDCNGIADCPSAPTSAPSTLNSGSCGFRTHAVCTSGT